MSKLKVILLACCLALTLQQCHYTCSTCTDSNFYSCTGCQPNRGDNSLPIAGMCYCSSSFSEDQNSHCQPSSPSTPSSSSSSTFKLLLIIFIGLTLVLSLLPIFTKGMRYFLFKAIEDIQQLSLILLFNIYFPLEFDLFLTYLYKFNISSSSFQNIDEGSLQVKGKYQLLSKTDNFLGNMLTWLSVAGGIAVVVVVVKAGRNWMRKARDLQIVARDEWKGNNKDKKYRNNESLSELDPSETLPNQQMIQRRNQLREKPSKMYSIVNTLHNLLWFNLLIVFFYFSLIEVNINIFFQLRHLTFDDSFATAGSISSIIFLLAEAILLAFLLLKAKKQMAKPEWMRDPSLSPTIYLLRTNYKSAAKYFWFISCLKKILLALSVTLLYQTPSFSIIIACFIHATYLIIAIYCQPHERRYLRAHFYLTQGGKLFLLMSLVNFTANYASTSQLMELTGMMYGLLVGVLAMHFVFLVGTILLQKEAYQYYWRGRCGDEEDGSEEGKERVGYRAEERLFVYVQE